MYLSYLRSESIRKIMIILNKVYHINSIYFFVVLEMNSTYQLCDGKGATISFARVKDSKQIIGGYNPLNWSSNSLYANTNDSFLFKIIDSNNLNSAQIDCVYTNQSNAIYH